MPSPRNPTAFTDTMADILRLPNETLAMSYIYRNKYLRFQRTSETPDLLDPYTLALATLSLSSKSTESPRRMREFLLPAHRLLHPLPPHSTSKPPATIPTPLTVPSQTYDTLRATLVQAELILLRVLGFELRLPTPLEFLPRYLERALEPVASVAEDYEAWGREGRDEYGVVGAMETGVARACRSRAVEACKSYQLANLFPARAVALGCLFVVMGERGLDITEDLEKWVDGISSGKVDREDFEEVVEEIKRL